MTEIIRDIRSFGILGEKVLIALRHRMYLRDAGNDIQVISYPTALLYGQQSLGRYLWPLCSDAVQKSIPNRSALRINMSLAPVSSKMQ